MNTATEGSTAQTVAAAKLNKRFWAKVSPEENTGCWLWTGCINQSGYGHFWFEEKVDKAHRASYIMHVGEVPEGLVIDHLCRVRSCVNPDHLEPVTRAENVRRGDANWRVKLTHCCRGHEFNKENTYWRKNSLGAPYRACLKCRTVRDRSRRQSRAVEAAGDGI